MKILKNVKLEVIVKILNITVKKTKNKNLCKKDETFNDKQEKCIISSPQCKSSEYYNQRLKRCLTKRRCYPPKEFNEKTEKCEEKLNGEDKCKSNEYYSQKTKKCESCPNGKVNRNGVCMHQCGANQTFKMVNV